jgi:hypothetical protein
MVNTIAAALLQPLPLAAITVAAKLFILPLPLPPLPSPFCCRCYIADAKREPQWQFPVYKWQLAHICTSMTTKSVKKLNIIIKPPIGRTHKKSTEIYMYKKNYFRRLAARPGPESSALRLPSGGAALCDLERVFGPSLGGLSEDPESSAVDSSPADWLRPRRGGRGVGG